MSVMAQVGVPVDYLLQSSHQLPPQLREDLDMVLLRSLLLKEAIILHKSSRTILVADSGFEVSAGT